MLMLLVLAIASNIISFLQRHKSSGTIKEIERFLRSFPERFAVFDLSESEVKKKSLKNFPHHFVMQEN